jgi:hypothetical protein
MWGDASGPPGAAPWARVTGGAHMCWGSAQEQAAAFFNQVCSDAFNQGTWADEEYCF